jgi:hypothetical protein
MHFLGKLLVIWGVLLPLIALPFTAFGYYAVIPLLGLSLHNMPVRVGSLTVSYDTVIVGALVLVGVGLSCCVLPRRRSAAG